MFTGIFESLLLVHAAHELPRLLDDVDGEGVGIGGLNVDALLALHCLFVIYIIVINYNK